MDFNPEVEVSAALIRGENPRKIARRLAKRGVAPDEIDRLLGQNAEILASRKARRRGRMAVRIVGAVIFFPSLIWNVYYLFFWRSGWLISGLFWAVTFYGLIVMLLGDFGGGFLAAVGRQQRPPRDR